MFYNNISLRFIMSIFYMWHVEITNSVQNQRSKGAGAERTLTCKTKIRGRTK